VRQRLAQRFGTTVQIGTIRVGVPFRLILADVRIGGDTPEIALRIHRIMMTPTWVSWSRRLVWLAALEIDQPFLPVRRTQEGTLVWPSVEALLHGLSGTSTPPADEQSTMWNTIIGGWQTAIHTVQLAGGTIEFTDDKTGQPFQWSLSDLFFIGGPIAEQAASHRIPIAWQGRLVGDRGFAASSYCSGWVHLRPKEFELTCQLQPLRLAAFQPYYQGPTQWLVHHATLTARSHAIAKANQLEGRVQLEIENLSEADVSALGDIKTPADGSESVLTGEIHLSGPLDRPAEWSFQLVPGNEIVQRLMKPLLSRGGGIVRIKVGTQTIPISFAPATEEALSDQEAVKKQVEEHLAIIAPVAPEAPPVSPPLTGTEVLSTQPPTEQVPEAASQVPATSASPTQPEPLDAAPAVQSAPPSSDASQPSAPSVNPLSPSEPVIPAPAAAPHN